MGKMGAAGDNAAMESFFALAVSLKLSPKPASDPFRDIGSTPSRIRKMTLQSVNERVIFHFSLSEGGIETWVRDFLSFGGGNYSVFSTSPTLQDYLKFGATRKFGSVRFRFHFFRTFRHHFRCRGQRSEKVFLVFNAQSAVFLLFLLPRARFIYFSCANFGNQIPLMSPLRRLIFPRVEKFLLKRAEFVFTMSFPDSKRIARIRPNVETIDSIYNDRVFGKSSSSGRNVRGILWIGRLVDLKDPHLAISAFEASADSHRETLTMIGEGPLEREIRERIAISRYKNRMRLSSRLEAEELASQIRAARLVVATSKTEAGGRTVPECLACGTPVVATAESDPENWIRRTRGGSVSEDRTVESIAYLIRENLDLKPQISDDLLASAKASEAMPRLEGRISHIFRSILDKEEKFNEDAS